MTKNLFRITYSKHNCQNLVVFSSNSAAFLQIRSHNQTVSNSVTSRISSDKDVCSILLILLALIFANVNYCLLFDKSPSNKPSKSFSIKKYLIGQLNPTPKNLLLILFLGLGGNPEFGNFFYMTIFINYPNQIYISYKAQVKLSIIRAFVNFIPCFTTILCK